MADGCRPRGSVEKDGRDQQAGQGDVHCDEPAQQSSAGKSLHAFFLLIIIFFKSLTRVFDISISTQ